MGKPYSLDLRERVVGAIEGGMSTRAAAARFSVGIATAGAWARLKRATGAVRPAKQGKPKGSVLDAHADFIFGLIEEAPDTTLDEMVEVTFTVSPRVRHIAAHNPDTLSEVEYYRQIFWSSGVDLPETLGESLAGFTVDSIELAPGEKAVLSVQLPNQFVIAFDPVTHGTQFIDVKGEPTHERQSLGMVFNKVKAPVGTVELRPGPLRVTLENRTDRRVLPALWIAGDSLHNLLGQRRPFLTAKRLLSNQTFRDVYNTDTLDVDQRLKITSLTFLFTDLKGSTALYERVGDLAAYDLVRQHFRVLYDVVGAETGAVVKTIGDAVMATFTTPDRALAAALRMRKEMAHINAERGNEDLLLKIGIHEGPCLAVTLNNNQDYFGHTVNVAARVQGLASAHAIFATKSVVEDTKSAKILESSGLQPTMQLAALRGVADETMVYEIP